MIKFPKILPKTKLWELSVTHTKDIRRSFIRSFFCKHEQTALFTISELVPYTSFVKDGRQGGVVCRDCGKILSQRNIDRDQGHVV